MRTSTCLLPKVSVFAVLALALLVGHVRTVHAQDSGEVVPASYQSGGFFNQNLGTALRFNYHTQGYGTQDDVFSLGGMKVFNMEGATAFIDGQGTLSDDFGGGFNLGVGYRELVTTGMSVDPERIMGVGFWTDGQSTASDNFFTQLGFSLESLGDSFDVRLNGSFPLERTQSSEAILTGVGSSLFAGNNLFNATERVTIDTAHNVVDGEFAKRIRDLEAWAFIGGYQIGGGGVDATGYRLGVRGYAVPDLALSLQVTDDDQYATNVMFGATWFIGRTNKCNGPCGTILDRFREPVLRNDFIATTSRQFDRASGDAAIDPDTGLAKNFLFVDSNAGAGGDGTFENPFNTLQGAEDVLASNDTVFGIAGSTFTDTLDLSQNAISMMAVTDADFIGQGNDIVHVCQTTNFGLVTLPGSSAAAPMLNLGAGQTAFTAGDNSMINNAIVNTAATGVLAQDVTAPQVANLEINDVTDGVVLMGETGGAIVENTVVINRASGRALVADGGAGGADLAATINDTTGRSLVVQNKTGGTINYTGTIDDDTTVVGNTSQGVLIDSNMDTTVNMTAASSLDIRVDGAMETGIQISGNTSTAAATPATVNAQGMVDITATGDANGLAISGSDATADIDFADLNATAVDGNTVSVAGEGTVDISSADATRMIENTGAGDALDVTGDSVLTVNSNVVNTVGGRAVDIQNRTANDVTVFGDVTATDTEGINIADNSAGQLTFSGETRLNNTAVANADNALTMFNNEGAAVSFTDIQASAVDGNTVDVTGGGTLTINDPNMTNMIVNTGTGTAVRILGNGNGDAIVGVGAPVTNSVGGRAVDIQSHDSNDITFNDTVTDTGNGLLIANNDGGTGTIAFTQAVTSTTSGANIAIDLDTNTDKMITFNGVMATTTGTGTAFRGVGGGNLVVASPNILGDNTIMTSDGIGLDLQNMTVDPGNVTFEIFNVTGANVAAMGINLRNLDGTGQVVIGGTDATQGGQIGSAGTAINIDNAARVSITGVNVANNAPANAGAGVVVTNQAAGSLATFTDMELNTFDGDAVNVNGNAEGIVTFSNLTATTSGTGDGIDLDNADGSNVAINVASATVNANGTGRGFAATGGGTITMNGTNVVNSTGNTAFEVTDVESLSASGVTIANTDQFGVVVTGQNAATDSVTLTNFDVTTTSVDAVTIGDAVLANSNTAGTVTLNNLTANSDGVGDSVVLINNTGATVDVNGINATAAGSGTGFSATGGGTLSAVGTNNVSANTGQGVEIEDMTIAAGGAAFSDVDVTAGTSTGVNLTNNTGGTITVNGGTMTTVAAAVNVENSDSVAVNGVDINNTAGTGILASNSAGDSLTLSNVDVNTTSGTGVDVDGGTFTATGANSVATTTGVALDIRNATIGGGGANFNTVNVTNGASNGILLEDLSGGQVRVGSAAVTGTDGAGGTLNTAGSGIVASGVTNAVFNDIAVESSGTTAVIVEHTTAAASAVTFNNLAVTSVAGSGNGVVVTDNGSGELDFTLRDSTIDVAISDTVGFTFVTGANAGEVDIRLDNNTIMAGNNSAVLTDLNSGTGDVQFLVNGGNNWSNTSAGSATASITNSTGRTLNATIGDQDGTAPFDENVFANGNGAGNAFEMTSNNAAAIVSLDLRGNNASGGGLDYELTEAAGTFGIVDLTETVTNETNNAGGVDLGGGIEADFDDLVPPIKQVD